jgi:phytoene dehydrogenase-like protein
VIGAGLAGLAAAATAAKGGASTVVLDARSPGGRARTATREGFTFNLGPHALYRRGEGMRVLQTLGVEPVGSEPPLSQYKLLIDGALHRMPVSPGSLLRTTALGTRSKASLSKLLAWLPRLDARKHAGISVDDWIAEQSLRPDADAVLRALLRIGTYCNDFSDLSADTAIFQMQRAASGGVLYLDGGWTQLVDGLRGGLDVRTRTRVDSVRSTARHVEVTTPAETFHARTAVVAAGTPLAALGLLGALPGWTDIGDPLTGAVLDLGVRGLPSPGYVLGVDEPIYGTTQSPPARQAPAGNSVVTVIRYGARNAAEDRRDLDAWLPHLGVDREAIAVERFLARMVVVGAVPRAVNGGLAGRPAVHATGMPNVFLAGDWVGPDGHLADASLASGHAAGLAALRAPRRSATMVA